MTSCVKSAAIKWSNCKPKTLKNFIKDIEELKRRSDYNHCQKYYKEGSISCGFPVWATVLLVGVSVTLVAVLTCFIHKCCARIQSNQIDQDSVNLVEH